MTNSNKQVKLTKKGKKALKIMQSDGFTMATNEVVEKLSRLKLLEVEEDTNYTASSIGFLLCAMKGNIEGAKFCLARASIYATGGQSVLDGRIAWIKSQYLQLINEPWIYG